MELKAIYLVIKRNLILVLISTSLCLSFSTFYTLSATPLYTAKTQLFVSTPASALDISSLAMGSSFGNQRVGSYAKIVNSSITLDPVIRELGLQVSARDLAKQIQVDNPLDTVLLNVSVTDKDPLVAARVANAVGSQFAVTVAELELGSDQSNAIKVSVTVPAQEPLVPSSPNKRLNALLGFSLGVFLGVALSLIRLVFDNKVKNQSHLQGLPLLAAFMFNREQEEIPLISDLSPYHIRSESFAQLRLSFQNSLKGLLPGKTRGVVIVITSALPSEGKSTVTSNLAISLCKAGKKVLLIDADLRRPTVDRLFKDDLRNSKTWQKNTGLSELIGGKKLTNQIYNSVNHPGLSLLTSGAIPHMPSELLMSSNLKNVIESVRKRYQYVLIDSAPLLPASDTAILSSHADGVIVVVRANSTRTAHFNRSVSLLSEVGANIVGVVLNMIPIGADGEEYGYGYGYGYQARYQYGYAISKTPNQGTYSPSHYELEKLPPQSLGRVGVYRPSEGGYLPSIEYSPRVRKHNEP
jgi:capsular exopolysaccharide synthesis family protein